MKTEPLYFKLIEILAVILAIAVLIYWIAINQNSAYEKGFSNASSQNQTWFDEGYRQGQINATEAIVQQLYYAGIQCINITVYPPYKNQFGMPNIVFVNRECIK